MVITHEEEAAPQSNCFYQVKDYSLGNIGFRCLTEQQYNTMLAEHNADAPNVSLVAMILLGLTIVLAWIFHRNY